MLKPFNNHFPGLSNRCPANNETTLWRQSSINQNWSDYKAPSTGGGLGADSFCFSSGDIAVNTKFRDDRDPFGFATVFTISATFASVSGLRLRNDPCVIFCNNYTNTTQKYSQSSYHTRTVNEILSGILIAGILVNDTKTITNKCFCLQGSHYILVLKFKDFQGLRSCIFKDQFSTEVYSMDSIKAIINIYLCDYGTVLVDKNKTWQLLANLVLSKTHV